MRKYETIVVYNPELSETQIKDEQKKVETIIKGQGVSEVAVDRWGKNPIAYTVAKQKMGHFVCYKYETDNHGLSDHLTSLLRISDNVIKHQSHRIIEKVRKFKGNPRRSSSGEFDDYGMGDSDF